MAQSGAVFLAKARYRQRRLRDAIRILPVLGAILWLIPLLWPRGADGPGNASALIYVFGVWTFLVALGAVLTRMMDLSEDDEAETGTGTGAGEVP